MTDEENTFSFATDTGSGASASEPAIRAAHMAPAEPDPALAAIPEVVPAPEPAAAPAPAPAPAPEPIGAHAEPVAVPSVEAFAAAAPLPAAEPLVERAVEAESEPIGAHAAPAPDTTPEPAEALEAMAETASGTASSTTPAITVEDPVFAAALHILDEDKAEPEPTPEDNSAPAHMAEPLLESDAAPFTAEAEPEAELPATPEVEQAAEPALITELEPEATASVDTDVAGDLSDPVSALNPAATTEPAPASPLPTASLDDTAEIDVEEVETRLNDPGSTQSFEPITEERIDTGSTYDAGTTTTLMWGARSDVGCVRPHNEDSYLVQSPLFCVCDGMGGHAAGEVASSIAVETIAKTAPSTADAAQLAAAVEAANAAVIEAAVNGLGKPGMGCTATCAYLEGNTIAIAHVGDSRAYLLHEGTLIRVTRDHSYVEELVDAGEITADEARVHPNRSVITRALGSDPAMYADHFCLNIEEGDRLILCSDGLSSMVPDGEIERIATKSSTAQICVDNLVDAALAAGGHDNVTVVVVDVVDDGRIKELLGRRKRNLIIAITAVVAALVIAGIVFAVGISRSVFLGVNEDDETVAIYTGIHADLFGAKLYQIEDTTSVKVYDLPDDTRSRLEEGIEQDSIEQARNTVSGYRSQIDEDEAKQVENAEAIRKSTEGDTVSDDATAADAADTDTATDTNQNTQGGA